ncbi:hypothetical protein Goari_027295, partial [Gossypium aridum]|nr:hypothetical protein [Gossypium aridum]
MKKVRCRTNVPPDLNDPTVDENGQAVRDTNALKVSYKTKLLGTPSDQNACANMEKMFELQDGDVATEAIDGVSSITFSNRVWALWSLGNRFQLIDLENDFYLVRFQDKDDFDKVLMSGLWVIFGHYLMERLWSSDFSIANNNLDKQVVWIRLPELSKGCYSKFLLRAIGQFELLFGASSSWVEVAAGQNESEGKKLNLQNHVDDEPFGPYMLVV